MAGIVNKCMAALLWGSIDERVSVGCAAMTLMAGVAHTAQGILIPASCKDMNLQPWFMTCAGLWMAGSGALFLHHEVLGFPFMAASMGGAAATAAMSPAKPGIVFSSATLAAMAYTTKSLPFAEWKFIVFSVAMWLFGVWGRVYVNGDVEEGEKKD
mmetsp:Transcript_72326/g.143422  ORF Transcript_72326/g.143422 Transcript_72326/m.143422 type:complete len:156 (-) Transcript_72326:78-545(-)